MSNFQEQDVVGCKKDFLHSSDPADVRMDKTEERSCWNRADSLTMKFDLCYQAQVVVGRKLDTDYSTMPGSAVNPYAAVACIDYLPG